MTRFPFTAVVGADDLALALVLTAIDPSVGGVLVRGEKGTAKSTIVRGLVEVLPPITVVDGCRFSCRPGDGEDCPDGPHASGAPHHERPTRLVELPVGATEDRVAGSIDLGRALGAGEAAYRPGLLAEAHRGLLYVDEVNLLHDHLVDLLLDAAAMGRNSVERDGVSVSHPARVVLVGTMNPEEGELRPQLLDRFGLSVDVVASRDPALRTEVVRRRLDFDADPDGFAATWATPQEQLRARLHAAGERVARVALPGRELARIARVCAGFDVDGMRADIVIARAARAHAAWAGRESVTKADVRAAARFALPHRRRRGPFDPPGLDEDLLDRLLDEGDDDPTPPDDHDDPLNPDETDDTDGARDGEGAGETPDSAERPDASPGDDDEQTGPQQAAGPPPTGSETAPDDATGRPEDREAEPPEPADDATPPGTPATVGVSRADAAYRPRTFALTGVGTGTPGRRSPAITSSGRVIGARANASGRLHLPSTIIAAAPHQAGRGRTDGALRLASSDLRTAVMQGRESNLVLFCVDASGSMAARRRMREVKTAVLSLLVDAYERRDRVGLVTFRGAEARLTLPPTSSVEVAARALEELPHGGRTPLAEGLTTAARTLELEHIRDPRRRPLLVLVTDGRATAGPDALARAQRVADQWHRTGVQALVVDCESGRMRLGLAGDLASRMGATYVPLEQVAAGELVTAVASARATTPTRGRAA